MLIRSGPHHTNIGTGLLRQMSTAGRSAGGQCAIGPSGVRDQSNARTREPMSPPPEGVICLVSVTGANDSVALAPTNARRTHPYRRIRCGSIDALSSYGSLRRRRAFTEEEACWRIQRLTGRAWPLRL